MLLIGFGSKARQGKDVAGEAIVDYYNRRRANQVAHSLPPASPEAKIYKFAAALYNECRQLHGMTEKDAPLLQRVGAARRAEDPEYWIKQAFRQIYEQEKDICIITDVRYENEAGYVKKHGGYLVNVTRLNADGSKYIADDRPSDHPSETELDNWNWDFRLVNSHGHQALLAEQAITLVEYLRALRG